MTEELTIKKSTYNQILAGVVVLAIALSFTTGFVLGGGSLSNSAPQTVQQQQPTQQQAAPQQPVQPSRVQVSLDDDPVLGQANAPLTVIEFSDYQCPFCQRAFNDAVAGIKKDYVDTGKVKFVLRDFPLSFHQNAQKAAEAAECAGDQEKYWQMHDKLFEKGQSDGTGLNVADLKNYAKELGLNSATFDNCLDSDKYKAEVEKDFNDGQTAGVSGTPTFYIGNSAKGYTQIVGAQPYAVIKQVIEQELAS